MTRSRRRHWDRRRSNSPWLSVKLDSMWAGLIMEPELNLSKTATRASNQGGGGVRPGVLGQQWVELFILREKVMQTHIRSDRLKDEGYGNTVWCKSVAFLKTEFVLIV